MCGIIGITRGPGPDGDHAVLDVLLEGLARLEYRGYDSAGLALVGAVVAEFVAGTGGTGSGLAYEILQSGFQLDIPRMFAALVLLALAGIVINFGLGALGAAILRRRGEA